MLAINGHEIDERVAIRGTFGINMGTFQTLPHHYSAGGASYMVAYFMLDRMHAVTPGGFGIRNVFFAQPFFSS